MTSGTRRFTWGALVAGIALFAVAASATAATRSIEVSPEIAQPGDEITVAIHDYGVQSWGTDLYLIPTATRTSEQHCGDMDGAIKVAVITWTHAGPYTEGGAVFTLPVVPDGEYSLGEELSLVTPPCRPAGSFIVGATDGPDTAMERGPMAPRGWLIAGGLLLLVAAAWARRRGAANRHSGAGERMTRSEE